MCLFWVFFFLIIMKIRNLHCLVRISQKVSSHNMTKTLSYLHCVPLNEILNYCTYDLKNFKEMKQVISNMIWPNHTLFWRKNIIWNVISMDPFWCYSNYVSLTSLFLWFYFRLSCAWKEVTMCITFF